MKLYTEEQVREAYNLGRTDWINEIEDNNILYTLIPIELPSDEEIVFKSNFYYPTKKIAGYMSEEDFVQYAKKESFEDGAKWMKEQIFNQNK